VGRRLHHKVVVSDASKALVGGLNISDRYNDLPGQPAWLDWAILAEGEAAFELLRLCVTQWVRHPQEVRRIVEGHPKPPLDEAWQCLVRIRRNDWVNRKNQVSRTYMEMFRESRSDILIMSSYFLPGRVFRRNMRLAVKRGVNIRVILAGASDVPIAKYAERYMYRWLLRNGIGIHEYGRNILHGKIAVADGTHVTCGSYNVNNISAYASVELNLDVLDKTFGAHVKEVLERIIREDCTPVTEDDYRSRFNAFQLALQFLSYEIFRIVLFLFTFYFRQKDR
jgi:cardiolipin synthase